ncbi:C-type mannose receptor 2-like [Centroberyx affinis]|uniref:C-type mannose receptor 2-like n=1 Tax=Centroberyx affinis TaxID=166261 RepID=UPI003A5C1E9A
MDPIVFVILLLAGLFMPSSPVPYVYHFVSERKNWTAAADHCRREHIKLAKVDSVENVTAMKSAPTDGYADEAWIGLYDKRDGWLWSLRSKPSIYSWNTDQPDNCDAKEFCVTMDSSGKWSDEDCTEKKPFICFNYKSNPKRYVYNATLMSWRDAKKYCSEYETNLASSRHWKENTQVKKHLPQGGEAWIGLARPLVWYWSDTKEAYKLKNWQTGQPDNKSGKENCAAVAVKQGVWSDEDCSLEYPFFCYGIRKTWTTVVRMKVQSDANMEDPTSSAQLLQQLHAALANQGATNFRLSWKTQPVKGRESSKKSDGCL